MRCLVVGRRVFRTFLFLLVMVFIFPLLLFFAGRLRDPMTVHFHEPRGNAVKVIAEGEQPPGRAERILLYIMEFYQNGL